MAKKAGGVTLLTYTNSARRRAQSPKSVPRPVQTEQQTALEDVRQKRSDLADRQHCYAAKRTEVSKRRAAELQESEKERENNERVILEMERDVAERRQTNASNENDPEEVEAELWQIEEQIEANKIALLERVKEFQNYLAKQEASEKNEVRQLKVEQNELEANE